MKFSYFHLMPFADLVLDYDKQYNTTKVIARLRHVGEE
jgi:hypothetical protein